MLTFAGDTFDTGRPSSEAVGRVYDAFNRLGTAAVVMQDGNHEQSSVTGDHRTPTEVYFQDHPKVFAASSQHRRSSTTRDSASASSPGVRVAARNRAEDVEGGRSNARSSACSTRSVDAVDLPLAPHC